MIKKIKKTIEAMMTDEMRQCLAHLHMHARVNMGGALKVFFDSLLQELNQQAGFQTFMPIWQPVSALAARSHYSSLLCYLLQIVLKKTKIRQSYI